MDTICYWMGPKSRQRAFSGWKLGSVWACQIYPVLQVDYVLTSLVFRYWQNVYRNAVFICCHV